MITCKLPQTLVNYGLFGCNNPMFSRGANLSGSEVTKVAVLNGMNGEFTRVNCRAAYCDLGGDTIRFTIRV